MASGGRSVAIVVDPASLTLLTGETVQLSARATDSEGQTVPAVITWESSDSLTAAIDQQGVVFAVAAGTVTITAATPDVTGSASITVDPELHEFLQDYIEALFLGSGGLAPRDGVTACVTFPGRWAGFPRGTTVQVVVSNTLDQGSDGVPTQELIQNALETVTLATGGAIATTFATTDDPDPLPGPNEATATDHPDPVSTGCVFDRGCVHIGFADPQFTIMTSSRTVLREDIQPADAFVHDLIGHGIMGMCHIDQQLIGGNDKSLMAGGPGAFTGQIPDQFGMFDIAAAGAVYRTSLNPGAARADFAAAGLVRAAMGTSPAAADRVLSPGAGADLKRGANAARTRRVP